MQQITISDCWARDLPIEQSVELTGCSIEEVLTGYKLEEEMYSEHCAKVYEEASMAAHELCSPNAYEFEAVLTNECAKRGLEL